MRCLSRFAAGVVLASLLGPAASAQAVTSAADSGRPPTAVCSRRWSVVSSPNVGTLKNDLFGVSALSATDVWAAGNYSDEALGTVLTLQDYWDGAAWTAYWILHVAN